MNRVILFGRFGHDPSLRVTDSGVSVVSFSLATSFKRDGIDEVEWHKCVCFAKTADLVHTYFRKGDQILVEGRLKSRKGKTKGGDETSVTEILIDNFNFVSKKRDEPDEEQP